MIQLLQQVGKRDYSPYKGDHIIAAKLQRLASFLIGSNKMEFLVESIYK